MALLPAMTRGCSFSTSSPASVFLTEAILMGVRWNFKVPIVCVSVVAKDVEHLKKYLLTSVFLLLKAVYLVHYPFIDHQFCFLDV